MILKITLDKKRSRLFRRLLAICNRAPGPKLDADDLATALMHDLLEEDLLENGRSEPVAYHLN